jgi:hypothetical protein
MTYVRYSLPIPVPTTIFICDVFENKYLCMSNKIDLRSTAYDAIRDIGKEKIQTDIISDTRVADKYMQVLFTRSVERFSYKLDDYSLVILYEILLHFMLTACTLPSQRKVRLSRDLCLDLVIPNLQTLAKNPSDAVLIQFIRSPEELKGIDEILLLLKLKTKDVNIWLISAKDLNTSYKNYVITLNSSSHKYSQIIQDIDTFLKETSDRSLRFVG